MALSFSKRLTRKYRKVVVTYMCRYDDRFYRRTFKDCTLIQASNVFKAFARVYGWLFIGYYVENY